MKLITYWGIPDYSWSLRGSLNVYLYLHSLTDVLLWVVNVGIAGERCRVHTGALQGIVLMEQLIQLEYRAIDCCYMSALAHTKLGHYNTALQFTKTMLVKDPRNVDGSELQELIHRKVLREYLFQVAVVGGVVIMIGVLISMVMARR